VSEKMLDEFNKKCQEKEVTKSEALRECIRRFVKSK
jgi:metal-responsive CopG/Arc/MetJ family transcriptional regulator